MAEGALEVVSHRRVYEGRVVSLDVDEVVEPSGARGVREVARHGGSVAALAVHADGTIVLIRQYRYPVAEWVWEVPAGLLEAGEDPVEGARRELEEEVGQRAARLELIGDFFATPGFCDERLRLYRATGLTPVPPRPDDDEHIEAHTVALEEALAMTDRGEIRDAKTLVALLAEARARSAG